MSDSRIWFCALGSFVFLLFIIVCAFWPDKLQKTQEDDRFLGLGKKGYWPKH